MATRPGTFFDGTAVVTFEVAGKGAVDKDNGDAYSSLTAARKAHDGLTSSSLQHETAFDLLGTNASTTSKATTSFKVTFFHCDVGTFWNRTDASLARSGDYDGVCQRCTEDDTGGEIEVRAVISCGVCTHCFTYQ